MIARDAANRPRLGVGRLIGSSVRLLASNFGFLYAVAFFLSLAVTALTRAVAGGSIAGASFPLQPEVLLGLVVTIALSSIKAGVICLAALDAALGKRHTPGQYLRQALRHAGPLLVFTLLLTIAIVVGLGFLIVPGLYLTARYLPWVAVVVFENAGWSGITRARDLTEGYRWPLVGAILLIGLILIVAIAPTAPLMQRAAAPGLIGTLLESAVVALESALIATFTATAYLRLREVHDGLSAADLAATVE